MTEEERALEYRRMMLAREAATRANERRLAGNRAARRALAAKVEPLVLAAREALDPPDDPC